jgi:hypothetical protein
MEQYHIYNTKKTGHLLNDVYSQGMNTDAQGAPIRRLKTIQGDLSHRKHLGQMVMIIPTCVPRLKHHHAIYVIV